MNDLTDEELKRIINGLKKRLDAYDIKNYDTKKARDISAHFVSGALTVLNKQHPGLIICIQSGRNILKEFSKYLITE